MNENKTRSARFSRLFLLWGCSLAAMAVMILLFPPEWESNDDFWMGNLAAGALGTATDYLVFVHHFLGILLRVLYAIAPGISWIGVLWELVVFFSFGGILWVFQKNMGEKRGLVFWLCFLFMFGYGFCCRLNFTRVGALAAGTGYLIMFQALKEINISALISGIVLCWSGFMIRTDSWWMVTALAGGVGLCELFRETTPWQGGEDLWKKICSKRAYFLTFGILFLGVFLLNCESAWYLHSTPEIQYYSRFNEVRAELMDYPTREYDEVEEELTKLGVTREEYRAATEGFVHYDPDQLNLETMEKILAVQEAVSGTQNLKTPLEMVVWMAGRRGFYNVVVCLILAVVLAIHRRWALLLWQVVVMIGMDWYLLSSGRNPDRVWESLCAIAGMYLLWAAGEKGFSMKKIQRAGVAVAAVALILVNLPFYLEREGRGTKATEDSQVLWNLQQLAQEDYYYISDISCGEFLMMQAGMQGINTLPSGSASRFLYTGGWLVNHPQYLAQLREAEISNPYRELFIREDLFLIDTVEKGSTFRYIQDVYKEEMSQTSWSVCGLVDEQAQLIAFTGNLQAQTVDNPAVLTLELEKQEENILWLRGNWIQPQQDAVWYLQLTCDNFQKTYRILPQWQNGSWNFQVGIPRQELQGVVTESKILQKTDLVEEVALGGSWS